MTADDATATWLPVFHDMGLIGCLITPTVVQSDIWLMSPEQFIRRPLRWLECFGCHGAALTAAPTFGYAYVARSLGRSSLDEMDFSAWRAAIVGAERIDPAPLTALTTALGPHGFDPAAFLPAYGLAEATLAVTGSPMHVTPRCLRPHWSSMRFGAPIAIEERGFIGATDVGDGAGWLTGCGAPHDDLDVSITGADGAALPDGWLGEIVVTGPSVAAGYHAPGLESASSFANGALQTGDAGLRVDGELYVVGRMGDSVKVRGRSVFAEDLENKIETELGVATGRCAVVPGIDESDAVSVVIEAGAVDKDSLTALFRREIGQDSTVALRLVPRHTIPRTSSGKPRRRALWQQMRAERTGDSGESGRD